MTPPVTAQNLHLHNSTLTAEDEALIQAAKDIITKRYRKRWHHIGCAMRTKSGKIYTSIHVDTYVSSLALCAEQVAIGMAATAGDADIDTIVAVRHPSPNEADQDIKLVSPCGRCREMICDYGPKANVILMHGDAIIKVPVEELIPEKYFSKHK